MLTEEGGEGGPKPMPLTLNYRWRGSNGYTQPWMEDAQGPHITSMEASHWFSSRTLEKAIGMVFR